MAKGEFSSYQKKVISNYYENLDSIMLTKLQEIVTDLYLAETRPQSDRLWERAEKAMKKLKIKGAIIDHIMKKRDVMVLARNVEDWLKAVK